MFVLSWMYFYTLQMSGLCAKVHQKNFMKLIKPGTFPVKWNQLKSKSAQLNFYFYYFLSQSLQRLKEKYMSIFTHFPRNLIFNQISSANPSRHWSLRSKLTERLTLKFNIPHKQTDKSQYSLGFGLCGVHTT